MTHDAEAEISRRLSLGDIHVWYRHTEGLTVDSLQAVEASLSSDERARCARFHFVEDRRDFSVAHDLLRRSLSRYGAAEPADWRFDTIANGKPVVRVFEADAEPEPLCFSLSHTRGLVACAV